MQVLFEFTILKVDDAELAQRIVAGMDRDPVAARAAVELLRDDERVDIVVLPTVMSDEGEEWTAKIAGKGIPTVDSTTTNELAQAVVNFHRVPAFDLVVDGSSKAVGPDSLDIEVHLALTDRDVEMNRHDGISVTDGLQVDQTVDVEVGNHDTARLPIDGLLVWVRPSLLASQDDVQRLYDAAKARRDDLAATVAGRGQRARRRVAEDLLDGS